MASWQAHCISFVLRHTFKPRLARTKDAKQARAVMGGVPIKVPRDIRITQAAMGNVPGEWVEPASQSGVGVLLFLHGGGYFACTARGHRPYTTAFARQGFRVYAPDYRLAPENPFPAAVIDAVLAYRAVRKEVGAATPIAISGDSAGGGLALAAMLKLREEGDALPVAAALFSPLTDLLGTGNSRLANERRCAMFYSDSLERATAFYMQGGDLHNPLASPLYADLKGLPPLLLHVGADETLLDDSTRLAERARAAGVPVELKIWPVVPHDWHLFQQYMPEGRQSLKEASEFLAQAIRSSDTIGKLQER